MDTNCIEVRLGSVSLDVQSKPEAGQVGVNPEPKALNPIYRLGFKNGLGFGVFRVECSRIGFPVAFESAASS